MNGSFRIIEATFFLDGGSRFVRVEVDGSIQDICLDYSLPHNGRARHISITTDGQTRSLKIGSPEEKDICESVRTSLEREFGAKAVRLALHKLFEPEDTMGSQGVDSPPAELAPFQTPTGASILFVEKAIAEGKISL